MKGIYLLLGSNLGDRIAQFQQALRLLQQEGLEIRAISPVYETTPWGHTDQPDFLNAVIEVSGAASPSALLAICQRTEQQLGRIREMKWGPRVIDIDILFFDDLQVKIDGLIVPHLGIADRRFTLLPLCDLIAHAQHPATGQTLLEMLAHLPDDGSCRKTDLVLRP